MARLASVAAHAHVCGVSRELSAQCSRNTTGAPPYLPMNLDLPMNLGSELNRFVGNGAYRNRATQ